VHVDAIGEAPGTSFRTRRIWLCSRLIVPWRWTASSSTVESSADGCVLAMTLDSLTDFPHAPSNIRSGRSDALMLVGATNTSTVGGSPRHRAQPAAAFHTMDSPSASASLSIRQPSNAWSTITVGDKRRPAPDGRPRPDGNSPEHRVGEHLSVICQKA